MFKFVKKISFIVLAAISSAALADTYPPSANTSTDTTSTMSSTSPTGSPAEAPAPAAVDEHSNATTYPAPEPTAHPLEETVTTTPSTSVEPVAAPATKAKQHTTVTKKKSQKKIAKSKSRKKSNTNNRHQSTASKTARYKKQATTKKSSKIATKHQSTHSAPSKMVALTAKPAPKPVKLAPAPAAPLHTMQPMAQQTPHGVRNHSRYRAVSHTSLASYGRGPMTLQDGIYVGLQAGYNSLSANQKQYTRNNDLFTTPYSTRLSTNAWSGRAVVGYGQYILKTPIYLGAEIFAQNNNHAEMKTTAIDNTTSRSVFTSITANRSYGVAFLPGLKLNNATLGYLRLGYTNTNFEFKADSLPFIAGNAIYATSRSKNSGGFTFGVGLESLVYENVSIRGEFMHTRYASFSSSKFTSSDSDTNLLYTLTPAINEYDLGVMYHFG